MTSTKAFLAFLLASAPLFAATHTYKIDPIESTVAWVGKKVTGQHNGTLKMKGGKVELDGTALKSGEFVVDMTTLTVLDLTDADSNGKLTGHLKSDDFFSVDKNPTAKFTVKSVTEKGGVSRATGAMEIKGISHDITIPLKIDVKAGAATITGKASLDRTKWNIKFRSGKFYENLGDKLIYDSFDITFDLKAKP